MSSSNIRERRLSAATRAVFLVPVVILLLAPSFVILPMSFSESRVLSWPPRGFTFDWYATLFASGQWGASAQHSVEVALVSTAIALLLGVPAGVTLGLKNWRFRDMTLALIVIPLVIPTIVLAIGMYKIYGWLGLHDMLGLAAAHAMIGVPLVVITTMSSARQINPVLLLAARSLGASRAKTFFLVTLPLARGGIISGAIFAFVSSWDEVVIANFLSSPTYRTVPVQMWAQITERVDPTVAAMASVLFAVSMAMMVALTALRWRQSQ
ncbi:MAG: ABC transporter permease [Rhizobiaceae bacterium]|nr:ABC transporter permease [Rhizobiaceae bacterium]